MTPPKKPGEEPESPPPDRDEEESAGVAGEVLRNLGDLIPGLGGLIRGLERSEAFHERLAEIDEEVEARLRGAPAWGDLGEAWRGRRRPPGALSRGRPASRPSGQRRARARGRGKERHPREVVADVFEEADHLRVVAEMPGAKEDTIRVDLQGDRLFISARSPQREYQQSIPLPGSPKSVLETSYKNGVLEVRLARG